MADKSDISHVLSRGSAEVERGRLRFFAKATGETRVRGVYDKKNGALHFVEQATRVENHRGEHVADSRLTIVERRG
jgi:hypothetical protein